MIQSGIIYKEATIAVLLGQRFRSASMRSQAAVIGLRVHSKPSGILHCDGSLTKT